MRHAAALPLALVSALWAPARAPAQKALDAGPLPPGAIARLGEHGWRHSARVDCVAYSPDSKLLASVGAPETLRLWDAATGRLLFEHSAGEQYGSHVSFSPDGKILGAEFHDHRGRRAVLLFDVASRKLLRLLPAEEWCHTFTFSPDGKLLARGGVSRSHGLVKLWEVATGKEVTAFRNPGEDIQDLIFSGDGKRLATVGRGPKFMGYGVRVWDVASGKLLHKGGWGLLALNRRGNLLLTREAGRELTLWDVDQGKKLREWTEDSLAEYVFTPYDGLVILSHHTGLVRRLDARTGQEVWRERIPRHNNLSLGWASLAPDRDAYVLSEELLLDLTGKPRRVALHGLATSGRRPRFCLSPDRKRLAAAVGSHIRLWDVTTGKEISPDGGHLDRLLSLEFLPDGKSLLSAGLDGSVRLWDLAGGRQARKLHHGPEARTAALSPDGKTVAAAGPKEILLLELSTGRALGALPVACDRFAFAPDGKTLAARLSGPPRVDVWDVAARKQIRRIPLPGPAKDWASPPLAFAPDGRALAVGGSARQIALFDPTSGKELLRLEQPKRPERNPPSPFILPANFPLVLDLAFAPDGRSLLSVNNRPEVLAWPLPGGGPARTVATSLGTTFALAPDGRTLAFATGHAVSLVEASTGTWRQHLHEPNRYPHAPVAFSPDGRLVAVPGTDDRILVWDLFKPEKVEELTPARVRQLWERELTQPKLDWGQFRALVNNPGPTVAWLAQQVRPVPQAPGEQVARWIADLNDRAFAVRQKAFAELTRLRDGVEAELRGAQQGAPLEVRRRLGQLLERATDGLGPETLRDLRSLEILERIGTAEARQVLRRWAAGAAQARLTREARAALRRLSGARP
jgi:WD40 repeat protein